VVAEACDNLEGVILSQVCVAQPVCPTQFRTEVCTHVFAFDQPGPQIQNDSTTGEMVGPNPSNELIDGVVGVVWNDHHVMMTRYCDKSRSLDELSVEHFAQVGSLCPEDAILTFETHSEGLIREWDVMMQWKERGYKGLDSAECAEPWSRIMHDVESGHRRVQIQWEHARGSRPSRKHPCRMLRTW
jgi:hypothetical protein